MRHFGFWIVGLSLMAGSGAVGVTAQDQTQQPPSLADLARKERQERSQSKPAKVYTNDNLPPASVGGVTVGPPPKASMASGRGGASASADETYFRNKNAELKARKALHERQLAVLNQKLDVNQAQYYPDPNKTLLQQYSRGDINKKTDEIEKKKAEIAADDQALADLQDELRRKGGDPGWLREGPVPKSQGSEPGKQSGGAKPEEKTPSGKMTKDYWQSRFKAARDAVAKAEEAARLVEDELSLLQMQQARELNSEALAQLNQQVAAKQTEVDAKHEALDKAKQDLDTLEKQFNESGAPAEWSQTEGDSK